MSPAGVRSVGVQPRLDIHVQARVRRRSLILRIAKPVARSTFVCCVAAWLISVPHVFDRKLRLWMHFDGDKSGTKSLTLSVEHGSLTAFYWSGWECRGDGGPDNFYWSISADRASPPTDVMNSLGLERPRASLENSGLTWLIATLPLWVPLVVSFAATVALRHFERRFIAPGRCIDCDYDLTGNLSGQCPECAQTVAPLAT